MSWKTTVFGLMGAIGAAVLGALSEKLIDPTTLPSWVRSVAALMSVIGTAGVGVFARDNNKTSEQVNAGKPGGGLGGGVVGLVFLLLLALVVWAGAGCKSPEVAAYRSLGTISITVKGTMDAWGQYCRDGHATEQQVAEVGSIYRQYQRAMRVAESSLKLEKGLEGDRSKLDYPKLISQVTAVVVELDVMIRGIMEGGKKI